MQATDTHYLILRQTALAVIRDSPGCTRGDLAAALDLGAVVVADLVEDMFASGLIREGEPNRSKMLCITRKGVQEAALIQLVQNGNDNVYRRWTANDTDGRRAA